MERFGLVERAEGNDRDARTRPWRAVATGYSIAPTPSLHDMVTRTATLGVIGATVAANADLASAYLAQALSLPDEWQDAAEFASYGLSVTAGELRVLVAAIDDLLRPYLAVTRDDVPGASEAVHVSVQAFPRAQP